MMKYLKTVTTIAFCLLIMGTAHARVWTDLTGQYRFEAEILTVSSDLDTATFLGGNGKEYDLPIEALCEGDRAVALDYAKSQRIQKTNFKLNGVPRDVLEKIKQGAAELWPENADEQAAVTKNAVETYLAKQSTKLKKTRSKSRRNKAEVPKSVVDRLMSEAALTWPEDKQMQVEYARKQIGYYRILKNYQTKALPALVVVQIKQNAKRKAPDDYPAQLRYVHAQVKKGIAHWAKLDSEKDSTKKTVAVSLEKQNKEAESIQVEPVESFSAAGDSFFGTHAGAVGVVMPVTPVMINAMPTSPPTSQPCCDANSLVPVTRKSTKSSWRWFARTQRE